MKSSRYNYILDIKDKHVLFNGLTLNIIEISSDLKCVLEAILDSPEKYIISHPSVVDYLYKNDFLIDDEKDEVKIIKDLRLKSTLKLKYTLTILPTYNCNFSCWYCVQKHNKEFMNRETVEAIKKNITIHIENNHTEIIELHWFGGEPLLCINRQIKEISKHAIELCEKNGIEFFNNITTNGYLIDEQRALLLKQLQFKQFQITIDGDREIHNNTRNQNGLPSFDRILSNIKLLIDTIDDVGIFLRFNFTDTNLSRLKLMIQQINEIFSIEYRTRIMINAVKVWQIKEEKLERDSFEKIHELFRESGYSIADVELNTDFLICDFEQKHSYVIFHNGNVDKCNNIAPDMAHYKLDMDGNIINIKKERKLIDVFSSECECSQCKHLPICLGPCLNCLRAMDGIKNFKCIESATDQNNLERITNYCRTHLLMND